MNLATISAIVGLFSSLCVAIYWIVKGVAAITLLIKNHNLLLRQHAELSLTVKGFQEEFQKYFIQKEAEERARAERLEKRFDKLERGIVVFIAKHGGTLPDVGE